MSVLESYLKGKEARRQQDAVDRQNEMQGYLQQHGPDMFGGDREALGGFAQYDPQAAIGMMSSINNETRAQNADARAGRADVRAENASINANIEFNQKIKAWADQASAQEVAQAAAEIKGSVQKGLAVQTSEEWDSLMSSDESTAQYVGQFENRENVARSFLDIADQLEMMAPQDPTENYKVVDGALVDLTADGGPKAVDLGLPPDLPDTKEVQELRKEFNGIALVKAFSTQAQAFGRIIASAKDASPAGDLSLVFNFMKVLDPGSVVRESEFATAESAAAWLQESEQAGITVPLPVAKAIRKVATGQRLGLEQRKDFVDRAAMLYKSAEAGYDSIYNQYVGIAERQGFAPEDSLVDYRYTSEPVSEDTDVLPPDPTGNPAAPATSQDFVLEGEAADLFEKYSKP